MPRVYKRIPLEDRFWSHVEIKGADECWEWKGALLPGGYGVFTFNCKVVLAHRIVWELTYGEIEEGLNILHTCDNPPCCNPAHLWKGTNADNMHDRDNKGRNSKGSANGNTKLTEKDIIDIRNKREQGFSTTSLGHLYGIGKETARLICNKVTWKHI